MVMLIVAVEAVLGSVSESGGELGFAGLDMSPGFSGKTRIGGLASLGNLRQNCLVPCSKA